MATEYNPAEIAYFKALVRETSCRPHFPNDGGPG